MTAENKIRRCKSQLIIRQPFFGCLILQLAFVEDNNIPTMATDGKSLFWNRSFVESLSDEELIGVLIHEVLHCAMLHFDRLGNRELSLFNEAADYAINPLVLKTGAKLPSGCLLNPDFDGMSAEEIYRELQKQRQSKPKPEKNDQEANTPSGSGDGKPQAGQPDKAEDQAGKPGDAGAPADPSQAPGGSPSVAPDPGGCGGILPAPTMPAGEQGELVRQWEIATRQATAIARAQEAGNTPGYIQSVIDDKEQATRDWREELRKWADDKCLVRQDWTRPNRRFHGLLYMLPGNVSDGIAHLIIGIDTSGSIDNVAAQQFVAQLRNLQEQGLVAKITVLFCDTRINRELEFSGTDLIEIADIPGGGGTKFSPVMQKVIEDFPEASGLIYFTDLDCRDYGTEPDCPVLWACYGTRQAFDRHSAKVPFGEPLHLNAEAA